jgi:hypothetical protein
MRPKFLAAVTGFAILAAVPANSACLTQLRLLHCKWLDHQTIIMEDIRHQKFKLTLKLCPASYLRTRDKCQLNVFGGTEFTCVRAGVDDVNRCPILNIVPYAAAMERAENAAAVARTQQENPTQRNSN